MAEDRLKLWQTLFQRALLLMLTVSHFRGNPAAMNFVGGKQAQTGCDFGL